MSILQCLDLEIVNQVHISPESTIIFMYCSTKYQSNFALTRFEFPANGTVTATFGNNGIFLKPLLLYYHYVYGHRWARGGIGGYQPP